MVCLAFFHLFSLENKIKKTEIVFPEQSIKDFILFCRNKSNEILIQKSNCVILNDLAKKYQVGKLIAITDEYIKNHMPELKYHILTINNGSVDVKNLEFEESISTHLIEEIRTNKESLLALSIPSLFRIFHHNQTNHSQDETTNREIIDVIIEDLDRKQDSKTFILFHIINFADMRIQYFHDLIEKYKDRLNFSYIPSESLMTIVEKHNLIIQNDLTIEHQMTNLNETIKKQEEQINLITAK